MTSRVREFIQAGLREPVLLAAWPGMGHVALRAFAFLQESLGAEPLAELEEPGFFQLPGAVIEKGLVQSRRLPQSRFWRRAAHTRGPRTGRHLDLGAAGHLRVADAAAIHGVVVQERRAPGISPAVAKASAGAIEYVQIAETVNIKHALRLFKERDITIVGAEASADLSLWECDFTAPLAIVVGSEGHGLRRTVRDLCDMIVSLPMRGHVNSLNVSVAAALLAYEVLRQRAPVSPGLPRPVK